MQKTKAPSMTAKQLLADLLVGDIDAFVFTRRGDGQSWRQIASQLDEATGGRVNVSRETLRLWYPHLNVPAHPPGSG